MLRRLASAGDDTVSCRAGARNDAAGLQLACTGERQPEQEVLGIVAEVDARFAAIAEFKQRAVMQRHFVQLRMKRITATRGHPVRPEPVGDRAFDFVGACSVPSRFGAWRTGRYPFTDLVADAAGAAACASPRLRCANGRAVARFEATRRGGRVVSETLNHREKTMKVCVLGGGHGCHAAAIDLLEKGHDVTWWRRDREPMHGCASSAC